MRRSLCGGVVLASALILAGSVQAKEAWRTVFQDPRGMTVQVNEASIAYREEGESVFGVGEVRVLQAPGKARIQEVAQGSEAWMRVEVDCGGTLRYRAIETGKWVDGKREVQKVPSPRWVPYNVSTPQESFGYAICEPGEGAG